MPKALKIIQIPEFEKELRAPSRKLNIKEILSDKMQEFFDDLLYTMQHSKEQVGLDGIGLSAVQVNEHIQVFWAVNVKTNKPKLYINPEITILDNTPVLGEEGCLSIPDIFGTVSRPKKIKIKYLDRRGQKHETVLSGFNARVVLHEYDHLQGVLFIDKMIKDTRKNIAYA